MMHVSCLFLLLALALLCMVQSFKFMSNWKLPSPRSITEYIEGRKFGNRKLCVITGSSSGLGKQTTKQLLKDGDWHVICAVRDVDKMNLVAEEEGFDPRTFTVMKCDLCSFQSVRDFVEDLNRFKAGRPLDRLVCNAAVYQPSLNYAKYTRDGIEQQMQTNYLSHFLLTSLLVEELRKAKDARVIALGSVTGNDNTVGGGGVYPIADLRDLEGLRLGAQRPVAMMDGFNFNGAKGYKDTKLALMMFANALHERYHRSTGIAFSSIYPGCIADSPLFREKRPWFRKYFPVFMKYITGGYVSEEEAGSRLYQVIVDPRCGKSGVYWSWNGGPRRGRGVDALRNDGRILGAGGAGGGWDSIYENEQSDKVRDPDTSRLLWQYSTEITGAEWPPAKAPKSPCPTLKAMSFITSLLDGKERLSRSLNGKSRAPAAAPVLPSRRPIGAQGVSSGNLGGSRERRSIAQTEILFQPSGNTALAEVGERLPLVAERAGVDIAYKCKRGECGTCEVRVDGQWVRACQMTVPPVPRGEALRVSVPPTSVPSSDTATAGTRTAKADPAFFSPLSFWQGIVNNGLGAVGFVSRAWAIDDEFARRMEKEQRLAVKLAARKRRTQQREVESSGDTEA